MTDTPTPDLFHFGALQGRLTAAVHGSSDVLTVVQLFDKILQLPPEYRDELVAVAAPPVGLWFSTDDNA